MKWTSTALQGLNCSLVYLTHSLRIVLLLDPCHVAHHFSPARHYLSVLPILPSPGVVQIVHMIQQVYLETA